MWSILLLLLLDLSTGCGMATPSHNSVETALDVSLIEFGNNDKVKPYHYSLRLRRRLSADACPTIYTSDAPQVQETEGWNIWSSSCKMDSTYQAKGERKVGETVT